MKRALFVLVVLLVVFVCWRIANFSALETASDLDAPVRSAGLVADRLPMLDAEDEHGARTPISPQAESPRRHIDGWFATQALALEARCVDLDGRPLERVEVVASQAGLESSGESDADGRVRIERNVAWIDWGLSIESFVLGRRRRSVELFDEGEMQVRVVARRAGYAAAEVWPQMILGETVQAGELVLFPAGTVSGRVVDASGVPVSGARIDIGVVRHAGAPRAGDAPRSRPRRVEAATDVAGRFRADDVAAGAVAVHVRDAAGRRGEIRRVEVHVGETSAVDIVLEDAPRTPEPADSFVRPEVAGLLALEVVRADGAELPVFHVSVQLPPAADGSDPTDGFQALMLGAEPAGMPYSSLSVARGRAGPHRVEIPRASFLVRVSSPGLRTRVLGPFDPDQAPEVLRVELESMPTLRGRVLRDGAPVAGARVRACAPLPRGETWLRDGFPSRFLESQVLARTDREGRFALAWDLPAGTCLRAEAPGSAPAESAPLALDASATAEIEIVLARGGDLEGRVVVEAGRDPAGIVVGITRGDGFARTQRTDRVGRFRFEYLTPGAWFVHEHASEIQPRAWSSNSQTFAREHVWPTNARVVEGRTTTFELDLREPPRLVLEGRVLADGRALGGWSVLLLSESYSNRTLQRETATTTVDEDGRFELAVHEPGVYELRLRQYVDPESARTIHDTLRIEAPRTNWNCEFTTGTLTGLVPRDGRRLHHMARTASGALVAAPIVPDADDRFRVDGVLAGQGTIVVEPARSSEVDRGDWPVLRRVDVPAGGTAEIGLR